MDAIEQLLAQNPITIVTVIFIIFLIMACAIAAYEIIGKFSEIIGKPVKWIKKKNEDHQLLMDTVKSLNDLKTQHNEDVHQSIRHDEVIKESVLNLTQKVDDLSKDISELKESNNKDKLAEYKDKIGQSYRYYNERKYSETNPIPYWNHMEKEALEGLIKQYEEHGGKNSFVHSIVEPEMQKWKVID